MLPKVKPWRDAGDTPCRKNHQEEAKLRHLHTLSQCIAFPLHVKQRNQEGSHIASLCIASPLHVKQRNQEGSHIARCQLLSCLGEADHKVS
jgi:hypothetical protein